MRDDRPELQPWVEDLADNAHFINLLGLIRSTGLVRGYPGNPHAFGGTIRVRM